MRLPVIEPQSATHLRPTPTRHEIPHRSSLWPGIAISAAVSWIAMRIGAVNWLAAHGFGALTAAIVLGILIGNTIYGRFAATAGAGVNFSRQTLLRAGVILYGFRLTLRDVGHVGFGGIAIDALVVSTTFALTVFLGVRVFDLERRTAILIGAGSSICGAAAVMATEPVVRAEAAQVTMAISTVVVFGTCAIFIYPALYALLVHVSAIEPQAFGVYAGSTIHEVAQVFAAGRSVSEAVADTAVIAKLVRVMMLAPFLMILSAWWSRNSTGQFQPHGNARIRLPWFAVWFIAAVVFNSLALLPPWLVKDVVSIDTYLLAMAMAALGMTTHLRAVRDAGPKPLLLGGMIFVWLIVGGGAINWGVMKIFAIHASHPQV